MTEFLTANIGSYPRTGDEKDHTRHRRGLTHFLRKDISAHAFRDVEQSVIHEVLREQVEAELDEVTDGLISWADPISHFTSHMAGFTHHGLARYFDANFYITVPVFTTRPARKNPILYDELQYARGVSNRPVRMIVTGPLTLASFSKSNVKTYDKLEARFKFFVDALAEEIAYLAAKGALIIQVDEPALLLAPEKAPWVLKAFDTFSRVAKPARLVAAFPFFSALPVLDSLLQLKADVLHFDLTVDGRRLLDKLTKTPPTQIVSLGILNARHPRVEAIDPVLNMITQYTNQANPPLCYVAPSSGLEAIPRSAAHEKIKLLTRIKEELHKISGVRR